jgi:hypothetical protein
LQLAHFPYVRAEPIRLVTRNERQTGSAWRIKEDYLMVARLQPARQRAHWIKVARYVKRDETNFHISPFLHPLKIVNGTKDPIRAGLSSATLRAKFPFGEPVVTATVCGFEPKESIREMIAHNVAAIAELTERIKALDTSISRLAAERYPETIYLQQVSGVGPITSLYFVLKVGNPGRFQRTRDIGAFLGLCPKRDQSGETDKELRISKCGDRYLRRLLVSAAQYILGPFGADSALREHGLRLAQEGTARAKKRAVVAVARKLAVLLLTLWKSREPYESFPTMA